MRFQYIAALAFLTLLMAVPASAELFGNYISYEGCRSCHEKEVEGWLKTPHAHAFETLKSQGEEKQTTPGCVQCHVVDMDGDGGFIDMELTPELKDVQCESCHGPGLKHAETEDPADIIAKPDEASCRKCHTEGQDKNFDYEKKSRFLHGPK